MTPEQKKQALELTIELCKRFEGFEPAPYKCPAGVWTIGYGATYYPDGVKVLPTDAPISKEDALAILENMLDSFQYGVLQRCPSIASAGLLAACTDLAYNIGLTAFGNSTLCKVVNDGGHYAAIVEQFRRWNKAGGKVLQGLVKRREAEIALLITP